jgi:lipopolysaccharide transport system permease protein
MSQRITVFDKNFRLGEFSRKKVKRHFIHMRDLLGELILRDIKLRYKRSVLGVGWSLINPVAQLLVFGFIFEYVLPLNIPNYTSFLFVGLLVWNWFQSSLLAATVVIVDNRELVRKPGFKPMILPIVVVSTNLIHYIFALPILFLFVVLGELHLTVAIIVFPAVLAIQFLFTLGVSYFLSAIHVTFRDTQYLLGIFLLLGFYLSPVFYPFSAVPEQFQPIYRLNPLAMLINSYRDILIWGEMPSAGPLIYLSVTTIFFLWIGHAIFKKASYRFIEEL